MSKEISEMIDLTNQVESDELRVRDLITIPPDLNGIFTICKNEINLSYKDTLVIQLYIKIFYYCLMQSYGLAPGQIDFISKVKNYLKLSNNAQEVELQYKLITKPTSQLPADLLHMISQVQKLEFVNPELKNFEVETVIINLLHKYLTHSSHYSLSLENKLLRALVQIYGML